MSIEDHAATITHLQRQFASALSRLHYSTNSALVGAVIYYGHELQQRMGRDEFYRWMDAWCKTRAGKE